MKLVAWATSSTSLIANSMTDFKQYFPFDEAIILEDDRAKLSCISIEHKDNLWELLKDYPDLLQYSPQPIFTKEDLDQNLKKAFDDRALKTRYCFVVYDKLNEQLAGSSSYGNISPYNGRLEIGWTWIAPKFQKTGLNRHMKFLMLQYAFEQLNYPRVELKADFRNKNSLAAMRKIGATEEGVLRSHTLMVDGHRRDTIYFSILKNEWPNIKTSVFDGY